MNMERRSDQIIRNLRQLAKNRDLSPGNVTVSADMADFIQDMLREAADMLEELRDLQVFPPAGGRDPAMLGRERSSDGEAERGRMSINKVKREAVYRTERQLRRAVEERMMELEARRSMAEDIDRMRRRVEDLEWRVSRLEAQQKDGTATCEPQSL